MRASVNVLLVTFALAGAAVPALAQRGGDDSDANWLDNCRSSWQGDSDRSQACQVRQIPMHLAGRSIGIDGRQNGSIRVQGWDGDTVRVTARLQANAGSRADAERMLGEVRIGADGHGVHADGPSMPGSNHSGWSVSYVVYVPRRFDLSLEANNGSLRVAGVQGTMELRTTNGSVALAEVGGKVHARTQNGSLNVQLTGTRWDGGGLDAETQNGSVRLSIPEHYAAQLETGTVNGRIRTDIPITVHGDISRRLSIPLNGGGATVRALTTNGSVTISAR